MIFNLVWLPARQTGSSTRTKVLLRIMLRDTTACEDDLVKQALKRLLGLDSRAKMVAVLLPRYAAETPFPEVWGRFRCSACGSDVRPHWAALLAELRILRDGSR